MHRAKNIFLKFKIQKETDISIFNIIRVIQNEVGTKKELSF